MNEKEVLEFTKEVLEKNILNQSYIIDDFDAMYDIIYENSIKIAKEIDGENFKKETFESIRDNLLINYFETVKKRNVNYFFENVLSMHLFQLSDKIIIYLLDQNLDLDYCNRGDGELGSYFSLRDKLAFNIKNQNVMKKFLSILENAKDCNCFFENGFTNSTDICRLFIFAGELEKALEEFNRNNYTFPFEFLGELLENKSGWKLTKFYNQDELLNVIEELDKSGVSQEEKEQFLISLLYSEKIVLINIKILAIIKRILSEKNYEEFISYLENRMKKKEIALFAMKKVKCEIDTSYIIEYIDLNDELKLESKNKKVRKK